MHGNDCEDQATRAAGRREYQWLNAVDGFFAKLTRQRLKYGVFHSDVDLRSAINRFINEHNQDPSPFVWKADPHKIIAAVRRGHQTLESIH